MKNWALITGASAGIGGEFARVFASRGWDLVLAARDEARLQETAREVGARYGTQTRVLAEDLSASGAVGRIAASVAGTEIYALVNNAGFGAYGPFANQELANHLQMMQVNMASLVELTYLLLRPMIERRSGRILNVASTAAFQPGPNMNVYYATKAFVFSFSYALGVELEGTGVTVTALCPGLTRSEFMRRARLGTHPSWSAMEASVVADAGYRGMMGGKRVVIPGLLNKVTSFFGRRVPWRLSSEVVRRIHRPA